MKIAICIYGRINKCQDFMKNLPDDNTYDVYLSSDGPEKEDVDKFVSTYNPKDYIVDKIEYKSYGLENHDKKLTNIDNMCRHFINKYRVYSLIKEEYDVVMSLRCDLVYSTPFSFGEIKSNTIYIPEGEDHYNGLNDQIAYGDMTSVGKYMNIINNVGTMLNNNVILHPEIMTRANINGYNVNIERFRLEYHIQR